MQLLQRRAAPTKGHARFLQFGGFFLLRKLEFREPVGCYDLSSLAPLLQNSFFLAQTCQLRTQIGEKRGLLQPEVKIFFNPAHDVGRRRRSRLRHPLRLQKWLFKFNINGRAPAPRPRRCFLIYTGLLSLIVIVIFLNFIRFDEDEKCESRSSRTKAVCLCVWLLVLGVGASTTLPFFLHTTLVPVSVQCNVKICAEEHDRSHSKLSTPLRISLPQWKITSEGSGSSQ